MSLKYGVLGLIILLTSLCGLSGNHVNVRRERGLIKSMLWRVRAASRVRYAKKILLEGATFSGGSNAKFATKFYRKPGGISQAEKDFSALQVKNLSEVEESSTGGKYLHGNVGNNFVVFYRRNEESYASITIGEKKLDSNAIEVVYMDM